MEFMNRFLHGDCEEVLKGLPDNSIDLIFTSPPYADQRKKTYGGVSPEEYVNDHRPDHQLGLCASPTWGLPHPGLAGGQAAPSRLATLKAYQMLRTLGKLAGAKKR